MRNISFEVEDIDAQVEAMGADADLAFGPLDFGCVHPRLAVGLARAIRRAYLVQLTQGYIDQENPPPLPQ